MTIRNALAASMAAALLVAGSAASATIYTVTLTGNDERVNDNADVFGFGAGTITGRAFTEIFTIDTTAGNGINATNTSVSSNSIFDATPPYAVSGSLTIGGSTPFTVAGSNYSSANASQTTYPVGGPVNDYSLITDDSVGTRLDNSLTVDLNGSDLPTTLTQLVDFDLSPNDYVAAYITDEAANAGSLPGAIGDLYVTHISVAGPNATGAVPEPASWAMMIAGFGLVGGALRRGGRSLTFA